MKPIQDRFRLLCFLPSKTKDPIIKIRNVVIAVFLFLMITSVGLASACFIKKKFKTDFESSLQATMQMTGYWAVSYMMITSYLLRNQIAGVFEAFQNLYDKCNSICSYFDVYFFFSFCFRILSELSTNQFSGFSKSKRSPE